MMKSLAVALVLILGVTAADNPPHGAAHHPPAHHLAICAAVCDQCAAHCTMKLAEGLKTHMASQQLCEDCAAICRATSSITARNGPLSDLILTACADACKRCGDQCALMKDDAMMAQCAKACADCESMCRELLKKRASK